MVATLYVTSTGAHPIPTPLEVVMSYIDERLGVLLAQLLGDAGRGGHRLRVGQRHRADPRGRSCCVIPRLEGVITQLAIITYCIPIVAVGILAIVLIEPPAAGEPSGTAVLLAALSVFFTTVVGALLGLKSADKSSLDLIAVYGGSRFTQLVKVRLIAALPAILSALQIAVPAAFLGAVLGEFFGKIESGVGIAMILAQQNSNAPLVWALALASGAVALLGFMLLGLVARGIAPWSKGK